MTKHKIEDTGSAGAKVAHLKTTPACVDPPEGWRLESEHGYQAMDGTPAGRLVRLHDVVAWLKASRSIPSLEACRIVEASLDGMQLGDFYSLNSGDYASAFDGQEDFNPFSAERSFWDTSGDADARGVASLKLWLSHGLQEGGGACSGVAVKLSKAHELWGYGRPAQEKQAHLQPAHRCKDGCKTHGQRGTMSDQNSPNDKACSAVAMCNAADSFDPADGWVLHSAWGYMGRDATPGGRLLRLADLVRWLMEAKSLPRTEALDLVCKAITPELMPFIYAIDKNGGFAEQVPSNCGFGYVTPQKAEEIKQQARQIASERVWQSLSQSAGGFVTQTTGVRVIQKSGGKSDQPVAPGAVALVKRMKAYWSIPKLGRQSTCESLDDPKSRIERVAILMTKAHELWGYGRRQAVSHAAFAVPLPVAKPAPALEPTKSTEWTAAQLAALREQVQKEGIKAYTQEMVKRTGLAEREIRRRLNPPAPKKVAASPFDGLKSVAAKTKGKAA